MDTNITTTPTTLMEIKREEVKEFFKNQVKRGSGFH